MVGAHDKITTNGNRFVQNLTNDSGFNDTLHMLHDYNFGEIGLDTIDSDKNLIHVLQDELEKMVFVELGEQMFAIRKMADHGWDESVVVMEVAKQREF